MKRLLLLHGYTEDRTIFDPLRPLLPPFAEVIALELAEEFAAWRPAGPVNVGSLARYLVARYHIGPADVLIGHSMGGWIAAHIKEQTGATAILLSSFTDQAKIVSRIRSPRLLGIYARLGLVQNRWLNEYFRRRYRHDESRALHAQLIGGMGRWRRRYVAQQLGVLFAPVPPLGTAPDLRLHARADTVVRPPDEPYVELPGDHFAHYFYPQLAAAAIGQLLAGR
ncbi:alpha/beta fold hydrolase [Hymenobacter cheonanensis]|uniref:alpha/beta fold hydrolase n=1 Tax=Hymenobacter sp. CA2-7 TaxID=3063993 RepID=UPI002713272F|nr:alpha/beta hydrolase [Hymenobacter sp. CA2-7]MDO7886318.1 alpha/beta hydrolase [Hymenobacter sp. CA2-7]